MYDRRLVAFEIARKKEWDLPPCWILFYFKRKENSLGTLDVLVGALLYTNNNKYGAEDVILSHSKSQ